MINRQAKPFKWEHKNNLWKVNKWTNLFSKNKQMKDQFLTRLTSWNFWKGKWKNRIIFLLEEERKFKEIKIKFITKMEKKSFFINALWGVVGCSTLKLLKNTKKIAKKFSNQKDKLSILHPIGMLKEHQLNLNLWTKFKKNLNLKMLFPSGK